MGSWLTEADQADLAEVRGMSVERVTTFEECFPPLQPEWRPKPESKVKAYLAGGRVVLQGKVDLTIGVAKEYFGGGLDSEVEASIRTALKEYEKLGATIKEVSLPHSKYAIAVYYLVATAEASSNLARYDGMHYGHRTKGKHDLISTYSRTRAEGFGKEVQRRIMLGTYALSSGYKDAYYLKALKVRRLIKNDFDQAFSECDVILGPTAPTAAFKIGEKSSDPLAMYLSDIYTISCNLAGIAGISIPCGFTKIGLPIGLQIQAPPFEEEKMLRVAKMFENATDWHTKRATSIGA